MPQTIAFLGASGGCGLATLSRALTASHTCLALCRTPTKLTTALEATYPNTPTTTLSITQGNALSGPSVTKILTHPSDPTRLVDLVVFTVGGKPTFTGRGFSLDDPTVCEASMATLLSALDALVGSTGGRYPRIAAVSSTGISALGRDVPLLLLPVYALLSAPHEDKRKMEAALRGGKAGEWTLVRPTMLKDEVSEVGTGIRVGVEDLEGGVVERRELGYIITRDDVGKWMFENLVEGEGEGYLKKAVSLTN